MGQSLTLGKASCVGGGDTALSVVSTEKAPKCNRARRERRNYGAGVRLRDDVIERPTTDGGAGAPAATINLASHAPTPTPKEQLH
jgi:hypothetical protein